MGVRGVDCLEGLKEIADSSIHLVLTDPPYGMEHMDEEWDLDAMHDRMSVYGAKVGGLPTVMPFSTDQGRKLGDFLRPVVDEWMRTLKPGGFALCFSAPRLTHWVASTMEDAGFEIRDVYAWVHEGQQSKAFGMDRVIRKMNASDDRKKRAAEACGDRKTPQLRSEAEFIVMGQKPRQGTFVANWMEHGVGLVDVSSPHLEPDRFPGTVMRVDRARRMFNHVSVKPVPLLRHLIRIFTEEGSTVMDTFAGTGSTGVAAKMEGREFVGFEKDAELAAKAQERIDLCSADGGEARFGDGWRQSLLAPAAAG